MPEYNSIWSLGDCVLLIKSPTTEIDHFWSLGDSIILDTYEGGSLYILSPRSCCFGHTTSVKESTQKPFISTWSGTGVVEGVNDDEKLVIESGQYMESKVIHSELIEISIQQNKYGTGSELPVMYRTGIDYDSCLLADWNEYSNSFTNLGFFQLKIYA